ncbi:PTS transporter subunit IIABC [Clostridium sp. L2-50]|jgi:PTS system D-glucosamine-specific IIC component|uniref:PTS transporter subunit IIABC n=1 Tax=Clostridium sp. L2-50 TaxID=411489 RepID=UPI00015BE773|nr:PTS transporter subunit IIABC [Clostridium sp. L2-50]EDO56405.1 PTS system, glucose-like IIB component [Clostridium sp. L2-50]UEA75765.1 glucose PTS transporter subunit IIA [Lachnospiraceae bacterium GAM79]UEA76496.1 glucose PTS transporter subunit IIA [Lachnospiraceae bacterium GAM79]
MKDKIFGILQRVGRSFMLPIAILPVAGLLLGIGSSFTNETMLETYGLMRILGPGTIFAAVFEVMSEAGNVVFANLPILFAMGVAIGMAKKEKEVAALSAAIAFFIMHASINALITINGGTEAMLAGAVTSVCGITSLQMGVFGGILVGLGVAALHNRFYKIELPQVLSFFGGSRFVPIISALVYTGVGILMFFIWPAIQKGIYTIGDLVLNSGYAGTWVYGFMERLLIPFGLHHVFYLPFWQTAVGGTLEVGGRVVEGAQNIFFAQLADPSVTKYAVSATRFMSGKFPLMIFGLPGAALAMYKTAAPEKRKAAGGLLLSAALTAMITGITEPLEFTFLFVAPALYGIHCILAGFAYMLMHVFEVGVGMTFSGGLIDLTLFGIMQGNAKTNWIWIVIVGIGYFIVYYVLFYHLIRRFDLKTPGRDNNDEVKLYRRSDMDARKHGENAGEQGSDNDRNMDVFRNHSPQMETSRLICEGLGGKANISDVDCCATRLRCTVYDAALVKEDVLRASGASGVVKKGYGVQVIYGPKVSVIKSNLEDYLEGYDEKVVIADEGRPREDVIAGKEKNGRNARNRQKKHMDDNTVSILSPVTGEVFELSSVPDEAFSSGMMGDGIAVLPTDPEITAPVAGTIAFVFDTKHAIGLVTEQGIGVMIHIGIDTVKLNGKGFDVLVETGQIVSAGQPVMRLDLPYLKKHAPSLISPVIITELPDGYKLRPVKTGKVKNDEELLVVEKR